MSFNPPVRNVGGYAGPSDPCIPDLGRGDLAEGRTDFATVSDQYASYSADARGIIRHELVERRLLAEAEAHLLSKATVLDVGCGDGEMSLRLARYGFTVLGVDESEQMVENARTRLAQEPTSVKSLVRFECGSLGSTQELGTFGMVLCHGVLMYLPESAPAIASLAENCEKESLLSILTKSALSIGIRTAFAGQYAEALDEIKHHRFSTPGNLGITTRGDNPVELGSQMSDLGFTPLGWQGVRTFSDHLPAGAIDSADLDDLIALEEYVSWRDPYRHMSRLIHVLGRRQADK